MKFNDKWYIQFPIKLVLCASKILKFLQPKPSLSSPNIELVVLSSTRT